MVLPLVPFVVGVPLGLGIWGLVQRVIGQDWPQLRNMFFFPLGGTQRSHHAVQRQRVLRRLNGKQLVLTTADQREVSAVWAQPAEPPGTPAGVMLIGANAMVLDDLLEYAEFYLHRLRLPVLLLNLWGYPDPAVRPGAGRPQALADPGSPQGAAPPPPCPTELTAYQDGEAALAHMAAERGIPFEGILIHGVSIGAAVAAAVAANHPGVRVTMDQPFCTLKEVTRNMALQVVRGVFAKKLAGRRAACLLPAAQACAAPPVASAVAFLLVRMCFKAGQGGPDAGCARTDMFDNVAKARRIQGALYVIMAEEDDMMHPDVARRVLTARYRPPSRAAAEEVLDAHSTYIPGGHMAFFGDSEEACEHYVASLVRDGFVAADGVANGVGGSAAHKQAR